MRFPALLPCLCISCLLCPAAFAPAQQAQTGAAAAKTAAPAPRPHVRPIDAGAPLPTRFDFLRGAYGPFRANNDLLYYHLDVRVDPDKKSISGKNTIRFRMLKDGTRIQLDLTRQAEHRQDPLRHDAPLKYERDTGAVFVDFPETLQAGPGVLDRLLLLRPSAARRAASAASRSRRTRRATPGSTPPARGTGASIWWPNKDQWRDEVESMDISVAIPNGLVDVSNGKFVGKTDLGDGYTRWDWHVQLSDQQLRRLAEHRQLRALRRQAGRPAARFLRAARGPGQGQEAVCAGQGDARGLPALLRRVSVREATATS